MNLRVTLKEKECAESESKLRYYISVEEYEEKIWNVITVYISDHYIPAEKFGKDLAETINCDYVEI